MNKDCNIVKDLLPLYIEDMVSEETAEFIAAHLSSCDGCRKEFESMRGDAAEPSEKTEGAADKAFLKTMKKMNLQFSSLCSAVIVFFLLMGIGFTNGKDVMLNSLIMPAAGVFGYLVFQWKAVYKLPLLILAVNAAASLFGLADIALPDAFFYSIIFSVLAITGAAIACLLHYAFRKSGPINKKYMKILAFCAALLLLLGVGSFANALAGNPVSKALAASTARKYLAANYKDTDYELKEVSYSFKDGNYYAHIVSPTSMDGNFSLCMGMDGKIKYDNYDTSVAGHDNVANRLFMEYKTRVEAVLDSPSFPYDCSIAFGDLEFEREAGKPFPEGAVEKSQLINDQFYDIMALGKTNGKIVLYVDTDSVTAEGMAEVMMTTKELLDNAGISFYSIDLCLRHSVVDEATYQRPEGSIQVEDFLYSDMYEEGLIERIQKNAAALEEMGALTKE